MLFKIMKYANDLVERPLNEDEKHDQSADLRYELYRSAGKLIISPIGGLNFKRKIAFHTQRFGFGFRRIKSAVNFLFWIRGRFVFQIAREYTEDSYLDVTAA